MGWADFHNRTVAFRVGDWIVTTYSFFAGAAFFVGAMISLWFVAAGGYSPARLAQLHLFVTMPMVLVGLRTFSVLTEWRKLFHAPWQTLVRPGFMLHGGIFGGLLALAVIARLTRGSFLFYCDSAAFALPLGEAIARIGCHVYGCCWGKPTTRALGIRYFSLDASAVRNDPTLLGVKLHPVQLYSSAFSLVLFVIMLALLPRRSFDGIVAAEYCLLHPVGRFALERLRRDNRGTLWKGFSHTDLYSSLMLVIGICLLTLHAWCPLTPIAGDTTPFSAVFRTDVLGWIIPFSLIFFFAYGVHYKKVGSWIVPQPSARL